MNFIRLPTGNVDIHVAALAGIVNFTPDMQLALQVQYDNMSGNFAFLGRFRWERAGGKRKLFIALGQAAIIPGTTFSPYTQPNSRPRTCRSACSEPSSSEPARLGCSGIVLPNTGGGDDRQTQDCDPRGGRSSRRCRVAAGVPFVPLLSVTSRAKLDAELAALQRTRRIRLARRIVLTLDRVLATSPRPMS